MHGLKVASNTLYQFFTKSFTSAVGFIITILLAYFYGANLYGEYTKITAFIGLFYILVDFGLNAIFLKTSKDDSDYTRLVALRLSISAVLILLVNGVVFILPYDIRTGAGFPPHLRLGALIFSFTIFTQALIYTSSAYFQKSLNYRPYAVSLSVGSASLLFMTALFAVQKFPLEFTYFAYFFSGAISSYISLKLAKIKIYPLHIDTGFIKKIVTKSYPLGLMMFFNLAYFRFDIIVLSMITGTSEVAVYGYAFKYFEFLLAIPLFMANSIYPFLLGSLKNLRSYYALTRRYLMLFLLVSLAVSLPAWFFSPLIAVVKSDFIPSVFILRILIFSLPVFFITGLLQWTLIARGSTKYLLLVYVLTALLNLSLNLIFIPLYGSVAAAVLTGVSEFAVLMMLFVKYLKIRP